MTIIDKVRALGRSAANFFGPSRRQANLGLRETACEVHQISRHSYQVEFIYTNVYGSTLIIENVRIKSPSGAQHFCRSREASVKSGDNWHVGFRLDMGQPLSFEIEWACVSYVRKNTSALEINVSSFFLRRKINVSQLKMAQRT